ncbi:uroporphyrinogen-III synthase [Roseovarius sp. EL26]|uniref:uroporphyrinogen-III synthase n=1 Tax=Roseovarius sp. EL26 TaxID=2126672 RepID=UPI000EA3080E|nr:uroporphyrinogen-III synthase [Roseovarius sp. EL26]
MHPTILIIRPDAAAIRFERELHARFGSDLPVLRAPVMQIEHLTPSIDWRGVTTLLFTSHVAVQAFALLTDDRHFECYAVGGATAKAARDIGLSVVDCDGTAADLVNRVLADKAAGPLLYMRGEHISDDIAASLTRSGVTIQSVVAYEQHAVALTSEALTLLNGETPVILPLMSRRSAVLLFDQLHPTAPIFPVAISAKVATAVPEACVGTLRVAVKPSQNAVFDEVAKQISAVKRLEGL